MEKEAADEADGEGEYDREDHCPRRSHPSSSVPACRGPWQVSADASASRLAAEREPVDDNRADGNARAERPSRRSAHQRADPPDERRNAEACGDDGEEGHPDGGIGDEEDAENRAGEYPDRDAARTRCPGNERAHGPKLTPSIAPRPD